jgi:hypothetical protein
MSLQYEKLIPVNLVEQQRWIRSNWDESGGFKDATSVMVAFRTIGSMKKEHWMNRYAAKLTAKHGEKSPHGKMCHAELIFAVSNGKYVKASVIKKTYGGVDAKGKVIYKPGCVHLKLTDPREWASKYVFVQLSANREHMKKMLHFLVLNDGQPFNNPGTWANLVLPGGIGVRRFSEKLMTTPRSFFCTEFICTALQCLATTDTKTHSRNHWKRVIQTLNPATTNPNLLFRILKSAHGVYDDMALGKELEIP